MKTVETQSRKSVMALLIAAHNEELVLEQTVKSAIEAGMRPEHIYVVDDNSTDATSKIAKKILPRENVLKVRRSGKGLALKKAGIKFRLSERYRWIHIADADGAFARNYFKVFRREVRVKYAAATGYIKSLPGRQVSQYRVFEYTVGMELHRRFQSMFNVISVIPGPTSCFRSDIFAEVDFANKSLTEDFDVTLQIHRQKLGKIQFIPEAVTYTQDPLTTKDYLKQIIRWNRGVMQGVVRYRIGLKPSPIDVYLISQILQNFLFFANYFIWVPYLAFNGQGPAVLSVAFLLDVITTFIITVLVAIKSKRGDVIGAFPYIFFMRFVSLGVFLRTFIEVILIGKYRISEGRWENGNNRRYRLKTSG